MKELKRRIKNIIAAAKGNDILPWQEPEQIAATRYDILEVKAFASRYCGREQGIRDGAWGYLKDCAAKNLTIALMENGCIYFQREETAEKCTVRAFISVVDGRQKETNGQ